MTKPENADEGLNPINCYVFWTRFWCRLFGHRWNLLRFSTGRFRPLKHVDAQTANSYWHWRCERCGLYTCRGRFERYTKKKTE